jgi:peptidoglycan hydrolase-like protein with peptidoglycan-binding domain
LPGGPQACPALVDDAQSVQADTTAVLDRIGKRLAGLESADPLAARTGALAVADDIAEQRQRVDTIDARAATQGPDCAEAAAIRDRAAGDRQSLQALQNQADLLIGPPAPEGAEPTLSTAQRRKVQERLAALGHYRSPVDGRFGDGTRRAIALYQRAGGAAATGRLTQAQADALLADPATAPPRPLVQQAAEPATKPEVAAPAAQPAPATPAAEPPLAPPETATAPAPDAPAPAETGPPAAAPEAQAAQAAPDAAPKPDAPPAAEPPATAPPAPATTESPATTTASNPAASADAAPAPTTDAPPAAAPPPPAAEAPAAEPAPAAPIAPTQPAEPPADANMVPSARVAARLIEALRRWPQPPVVTGPPAPDAAPAAPDPFAELYARLRGHAANGEMPAVQAGRYELVGMALLEHGAESTQMLDADLLLVQAAQALDARDEARHGLAAAAPLIGRLGSGESRRSRQSLEAATAWLGLRIVAADLLEAIAAAKAEPLDGTTADRMSERLDQIEQVMAQAQDGVDELAAQALFLRAAVLASAGRMPDDAELRAEIDRLLK